MNTRISYLYSDCSNFKTHNSCIVAGLLTEEAQQTILSCLDDGEHFIPSQVGLPEKRFEQLTCDDHIWFKLNEGFAEPTEAATTEDISAEQLLAKFLKAKGQWDEASAIARLYQEER